MSMNEEQINCRFCGGPINHFGTIQPLKDGGWAHVLCAEQHSRRYWEQERRDAGNHTVTLLLVSLVLIATAQPLAWLPISILVLLYGIIYRRLLRHQIDGLLRRMSFK